MNKERAVCQKRIYERFFKRILDFVVSLAFLTVISPVFLVLTVVGTIVMKGNPFFVQPRPGKGEHVFQMIKFRTMTNARDNEGNFLPDEVRLNGYGKFLRSTSLDELPELWNIVKGDLSIVGPRPQLVRDMVFMNSEQRRRHSVRQGLTGLAQINGRNSISWEQKIDWDLKYIDDGITFTGDMKIIWKTIGKVFARANVAAEGMETAEDFGDYLLRTGKVDKSLYNQRQDEARLILAALQR